jgi:hypothetical protein
MTARLTYWVALWLIVYLWGCVHYPEPEPVVDTWCQGAPPIYGDDC